MIFLRLRVYGSSDWTECRFEGDLEELAAEALGLALSENYAYHVQLRRPEEEWTNAAEFSFEEL